MKKAALLAGVTILVVSASGCDSGSAGTAARFTDTRQLVQAMSAGTAQVRSVKFATEISVGNVHTKGQGQARFDGAGTALSTVMDFSGESWEVRLVDRILYVKVPQAAQRDGVDDKPWIKVARDGTDPFSQTVGGSLDQLAQQNDPLRMIDQVSRAGTIVRGERTQLDGSVTDHYWIDLELPKLADELPAGLSADAVQQVSGKADRFPMELWLDDRNLPIQVSMDLSPMLRAAGAPAGSGAKITARYTGWGTPVDVRAPSADQVGEVTAPG